MRGRSKIGRKLKRKQLNVMDQKKQLLLDRLAAEKKEKKESHEDQFSKKDPTPEKPNPLQRFVTSR